MQGRPLSRVPEEITDLILLRKLPGYTLEALNAEKAETVVRWLVFLEEEAQEEARRARQR